MTKNKNFNWLFAGADHHINIATENAASKVYIDRENVIIESNNIETPRLKDEEIHFNDFIEYKNHYWFEKDESRSGNIAIDRKDNNFLCVSQELRSLRMQLTENELERYKVLGNHTGNIIESVAKNITPGMNEQEIAGKIAQKSYKKGVLPIVNLVAADDRVYKFRHPIPKNNKAKKYVMIVLCAKKWGLIANATRLVHFGSLSKELKEKYENVQKVEKTFLENTIPGMRISDIFEKGVESYKKNGYPEEWKKHHQGGITGYSPREIIANYNTDYKVKENNVFAWNPSITGTKIEDTYFINGNDLMVITHTDNWNYKKMEINNEIIKRPSILVKNNFY